MIFHRSLFLDHHIHMNRITTSEGPARGQTQDVIANPARLAHAGDIAAGQGGLRHAVDQAVDAAIVETSGR